MLQLNCGYLSDYSQPKTETKKTFLFTIDWCPSTDWSAFSINLNRFGSDECGAKICTGRTLCRCSIWSRVLNSTWKGAVKSKDIWNSIKTRKKKRSCFSYVNVIRNFILNHISSVLFYSLFLLSSLFLLYVFFFLLHFVLLFFSKLFFKFRKRYFLKTAFSNAYKKRFYLQQNKFFPSVKKENGT